MRRRVDYHYDLPPELIAQSPAERRDEARLLLPDLSTLRFAELAEVLPAGALIVANDARVRRVRFRTTKRETGGAVELLLVEPTSAPNCWRALARASKPVRAGTELVTAGGDVVIVRDGRDSAGAIVVELPMSAPLLCERDGELPLPPYIRRPSGPVDRDQERYQTVFARNPGAMAAPTAGLHFTNALIEELKAAGFEWQTITLHVGLGTFSPVRVDDIDEHSLHSERYEIPDRTHSAVESARAQGRPIVAVGTTVVRALEAAALGHGEQTSLFITPGFQFRVIDGLVTNFHLPESSLLMLVSAFMGYEEAMAAYRAAVAHRLRFFSYGDAMFARRKS